MSVILNSTNIDTQIFVLATCIRLYLLLIRQALLSSHTNRYDSDNAT